MPVMLESRRRRRPRLALRQSGRRGRRPGGRGRGGGPLQPRDPGDQRPGQARVGYAQLLRPPGTLSALAPGAATVALIRRPRVTSSTCCTASTTGPCSCLAWTEPGRAAESIAFLEKMRFSMRRGGERPSGPAPGVGRAPVLVKPRGRHVRDSSLGGFEALLPEGAELAGAVGTVGRRGDADRRRQPRIFIDTDTRPSPMRSAPRWRPARRGGAPDEGLLPRPGDRGARPHARHARRAGWRCCTSTGRCQRAAGNGRPRGARRPGGGCSGLLSPPPRARPIIALP